MTESINFPNLGIHLEHVGQKISIFGFDIAYYGMIIGIGILAGVLMAVKEAKRTKQNPETIMIWRSMRDLFHHRCPALLCGVFMGFV